mmetsp:Transcript_57809/g.183283  ORF Transcript_57809/g.183283 Transcript_57809/m.183283 type:complete len:334 (-) Transcript_57809:3137-4138(-)
MRVSIHRRNSAQLPSSTKRSAKRAARARRNSCLRMSLTGMTINVMISAAQTVSRVRLGSGKALHGPTARAASSCMNPPQLVCPTQGASGVGTPAHPVAMAARRQHSTDRSAKNHMATVTAASQAAESTRKRWGRPKGLTIDAVKHRSSVCVIIEIRTTSRANRITTASTPLVSNVRFVRVTALMTRVSRVLWSSCQTTTAFTALVRRRRRVRRSFSQLPSTWLARKASVRVRSELIRSRLRLSSLSASSYETLARRTLFLPSSSMKSHPLKSITASASRVAHTTLASPSEFTYGRARTALGVDSITRTGSKDVCAVSDKSWAPITAARSSESA